MPPASHPKRASWEGCRAQSEHCPGAGAAPHPGAPMIRCLEALLQDAHPVSQLAELAVELGHLKLVASADGLLQLRLEVGDVPCSGIGARHHVHRYLFCFYNLSVGLA